MSGVVVLARDMTVAQIEEWGAREAAARKADLAITPRTAETLAAAQAKAEARRKLIGASRSWAASAVSGAIRYGRVGGAK